ncbi:MAG: hypothetical protein DDT34_01160 [Firmicutes bacterium]|nr:hypothetical protein [Bacillota bacterium]
MNGTRNIAIFVGYFNSDLDGIPMLYQSEDRRRALPLFFPEGMPRPDSWAPINLSGNITVIENQPVVQVVHWEAAGKDSFHVRSDWKEWGAPEEFHLRPIFNPIVRPGFHLTEEMASRLNETSGFGPEIEAALSGDERSRDLLLPPLSRKLRNRVLVPAVGMRLSRNPVLPSEDGKHPFFWGSLALGPGLSDLVDFKLRSVSPNFGGVVSKLRVGPTPFVVNGFFRSVIREDGSRHSFLDCIEPILVNAQDFDGGKVPGWMMLLARQKAKMEAESNEEVA